MTCSYLHSKTPHVVTVLWQDSDDVVTILSPRLFEMIIYWFFSQKCHILFHKKVGNSLQIIKYINLSRFQHILKL